MNTASFFISISARVVFLCSIFVVTYTSSQVLFGPKIGINNAWADTDNRNLAFTEGEHINRIQFGFAYDHAISKQLSIRAEGLYSEKGYGVRKYYDSQRFETRDLGSSSYWELQKRYLEVPVMLKWFIEGQKFKFYVNGGIYAAYWLAATKYGSYFTANLGDRNYSRKEATETYNFDNDFGVNKRSDNRIDYGLLLGGGVAYKIKRGEFFAEARYSHGLADRFVFQAGEPKYYVPQMNRNWSFSLGFLLTLTSKKLHKKTDDDVLEQEEESE